METKELSIENSKNRKLDDGDELHKVINDEPASPIDILNEDTLLLVFSYLRIRDLINIERVSKTWQQLSLMSWADRKKIYLAKISNKFNLSHLEDVLKRAGNYVTHLDFEGMYNYDPPANYIFVTINKYCVKLTHLRLNLTTLDRKNFNNFSKKVSENLVSLELKIMSRLGDGLNCDRKVSNLLKKAINLEEFTICTSNINGSCLLNLTEKCKLLSISHCNELTDETFGKVLNKIPGIENLKIYETYYISAQSLKSISNHLRSLSVSNCRPYFFLGITTEFKELHFYKLLILDVNRNNDLTDDVLFAIIDQCPLLEEINLGACIRLSSSSFRQLAKLKNLNSINFSRTKITDDVIKYLALSLENLKRVECVFNEFTTISGLLMLIEHSSSLTTLIAPESKNFDSNFFVSAQQYVENRSNDTPLTIAMHFSYRKDSHSHISSNLDEFKRLKLKQFHCRQNTAGNFLKIFEYRCWIKRYNTNEPGWCVEKLKFF